MVTKSLLCVSTTYIQLHICSPKAAPIEREFEAEEEEEVEVEVEVEVGGEGEEFDTRVGLSTFLGRAKNVV